MSRVTVGSLLIITQGIRANVTLIGEERPQNKLNLNQRGNSYEESLPSILRIIPRLRAYDPLPGDHRGTIGDDRSADLSRERRLSEQLRPRLPRALRRPRDLPGYPPRSRPRQ